MTIMIRSKVVKIGNSRGIRIPQTMLKQAGLTDQVEMTVEGNRLIVCSAYRPRAGWKNQFADMADKGDDQLLDGVVPTRWDEDEWTW
jgi:antitoxin MazE